MVEKVRSTVVILSIAIVRHIFIIMLIVDYSAAYLIYVVLVDSLGFPRGKSRVLFIYYLSLLGELLVLDCLGLGWRGVVFVSWGFGSLSNIRLLIKLTFSFRKP